MGGSRLYHCKMGHVKVNIFWIDQDVFGGGEFAWDEVGHSCLLDGYQWKDEEFFRRIDKDVFPGNVRFGWEKEKS